MPVHGAPTSKAISTDPLLHFALAAHRGSGKLPVEPVGHRAPVSQPERRDDEPALLAASSHLVGGRVLAAALSSTSNELYAAQQILSVGALGDVPPRLPACGILGGRLTQRRQDGALGSLSALATSDHALQLAGHTLQVRHPGAHVGQVTASQPIHIRAR